MLVFSCLFLWNDASYIAQASEPGTHYENTKFRLTRMHYEGDTVLENECNLARKNNLCAIMRFFNWDISAKAGLLFIMSTLNAQLKKFKNSRSQLEHNKI